MNEAWREPGFCVPNAQTYPFQWLWDSCFHSLIWAALGDERCVLELSNTLVNQHPDGFVPHMIYWGDRDAHSEFWGHRGTSVITQPPMFGHCFAELARQGFEPSQELAQRCRDGLANLLERPRTSTGLVPAWHPWETGCDDSARWDDWRKSDPSIEYWRAQKGDFVKTLKRNDYGAAVGSKFEVGSVGFNALVAWNIEELDSVGASSDALNQAATGLVASLANRWDESLATWTDSDVGSGQIRTLDALLPTLIDPKQSALDQLVDPNAFGAPFGPAGVHRSEPSFDPNSYWRGPAWPQLTYLLAVAANRATHSGAATLAGGLVDGALKSGWAEYWNPDSAIGLGAIPQTWAGLALCLAV
jgi:hypothetical protein